MSEAGAMRPGDAVAKSDKDGEAGAMRPGDAVAKSDKDGSEAAETDEATAPDVAVRLGTDADVPTVARLHLDHMDLGFLRTLGYGFLKTMYRRIVRSDHGFMIVAEQHDGRIIGYTTGSTDTGKLWREFVIRDGVRAGLTALPKVVRHPGRILETRRYPKVAASQDLPAAEWLTIAVDPTVRSRGLGMKLTTRTMEEFVARGTPAVRATAVTWNDTIFKVLAAHGYEDVGTMQVHSGTDSRVLVWHNPDLQG